MNDLTRPDLTTLARSYFGAIERGDLAALQALYHPDAVQVELPNRLKATGDRRGPDAMGRDFERGRTILRSQRYEVLSIIASGNEVASCGRANWRSRSGRSWPARP